MSLSHLAVLVFVFSFLGAQICNCFFSYEVLDDQVFCLSNNGILISIGINDNLLLLLSGCLTRCLVSLVMLNILNNTLLLRLVSWFFAACHSVHFRFQGYCVGIFFLSRQVPNTGSRWYRRLIPLLSDLCSMLRLYWVWDCGYIFALIQRCLLGFFAQVL